MARGLAQRGAKVGILGRREQEAERAASEIAQTGGEALPLLADVLDKRSLEDARDDVLLAR
jgi:NADP-dependent 3-hydroxy acid dehydrogenase YdfG